jgi:hypothetical protein
MTNFRHIAPVAFPDFAGRSVNMMPFIMGDHSSLPADLRDYAGMIDACPLGDEAGKVGYLTIDERFVEQGSQRRGGVHTEGFGNMDWGGGAWGAGAPKRAAWGGWGGGAWGGSGGLFIANTVDESCALYDACVEDTPFGGAVRDDQIDGAAVHLMAGNNIYWLHDRTPHASLPVVNRKRQFFRLVTSDVSLWFALHSTANPLGVQPAAQIIHENKFDLMAKAA